MEKILAQLILAAFFGWALWFPAVNAEDYDEVWGQQMYETSGDRAGEQRTGQVSEKNSGEDASGSEDTSGFPARDVFSAYIVGGLDCMEDGSYDQYVRYHVDSPTPGGEPESQVRDDDFPRIYLKFMGLDLTDWEAGSGADARHYYHKAFCSDLFYMEYPFDWYVGSTDACALTFVPEWEKKKSGEFIQDWAEYFDNNLVDSIDEVQDYIQGGGINSCLEEVLGKPITEEYEFVLRNAEDDWLLIYNLKRGEDDVAEIVVWCNIGKFDVRSWDVELTVNPEEDYGRIMVFQEWDDFDFSSIEAIGQYVESEDFLKRFLGTALGKDVEEEIISYETNTFTTSYHEFVCLDVGVNDTDRPERLLRQAAVYIPVTKPGNHNWVVVFETFPGSKEPENVYNPQVRERIMGTFVVLPFYHKVERGENLSRIARTYGEDPDLAYDIAVYTPNHISQPDLIHPGQEIQIPLSVLFKRIHH